MTEQVVKPLFVEVALWGVNSRGGIAPYSIWNECNLGVGQQGFATYFAFYQEEAAAWMRSHDDSLKGFQIATAVKPVFIPIDIDELNLSTAQDEAKRAKAKIDKLNIPNDVYFSGGKGFHLHISSKPFNVTFHADAGRVTMRLVEYLLEGTSVKFCRPIYRNNQLLRLPGSYHEKGFYKKIIPYDMLYNGTIKQIQDYCRDK